MSGESKREAAHTPGLPRHVVRDIFLAAGFTIKPGQTDLKPYVYAAADALIAKARAPDLAAEVERLKSALTKISGIRDSMIGCQKVNWSEHVYPLVAALDAAGFEGASYEVARDQIGTLLERTNKAEAEVERLRAEHEGPDSWEANAKYLLARCPYTVRQCPGGGPEDIKSSLVATFMGMQQDLAAERRKVEALRSASVDSREVAK